MTSNNFEFISFGEAMLRYQPVSGKRNTDEEFLPSALQVVYSSVGGDELNVCVALSKLGRKTRYISVLPIGPLGEIVLKCAKLAGVNMDNVVLEEDAEIGTFIIIPKEHIVHFQRRHSAFALHSPSIFNWKNLLTCSVSNQKLWLHLTGIAPQVSNNTYTSWKNAITTALDSGIQVSMDLNHRPKLGTLPDLWKMVKPFVHRLQVLVLALSSIKGLAELEEISPLPEGPEESVIWIETMKKLREKWNIPLVACCFKSRNEEGVQKRWSVICNETSTISTYEIPIYHKVFDECGGGSAWMAGFIDFLLEKNGILPKDSHDLRAALHRADLLAALCQQTLGDHSDVTRSQLQFYETNFLNASVNLVKSDVIESTLQRMKNCGIIAILRAKNPQVAVERGLELASMGCRALEVTMDTPDVLSVLDQLSQKLPSTCLLGVGTVMDFSQVSQLASKGVKFAISPINPKGFVKECEKYGIVSVPAGFTPNEFWDMHKQGANAIKIFPAQMWSPANLKALLAVGDLGSIRFIPSGGISASNFEEWLDSGAFSVGMGSKLCGSDINFGSNTEEFNQARKKWMEEEKPSAQKVFDKIKQRYK